MTFAIRFGSSVPAFQRVKFGSETQKESKEIVLTGLDTMTTLRREFGRLEQGEITSLFVPTVTANPPAHNSSTSALGSITSISAGTSSHYETISTKASVLATFSKQKSNITVDKEAERNGVKGTLYTYTKSA